MKHKQIAALIGMALLLIAVSSTALAVNSMWCNNCDKFVEFTSLGFRKIDETAHAVVVKCNECGTEKWASTGPHVGGTATCAQKAVCRGCGAEYGEKLSYHKNTVLYSHKVPTCTEIGWNAYETCSRCKDSYTANPTDKLGHKFGAWSPNGTGSQSAGCLRQGCAHIGSTDCRKFTFRTAEGETLIFCPVCGQAENAAQLEKLEAATAWAVSGCLFAEDVTARTNGEYLSVAFETAGSLTQPTGRVRLALPAGLLEGKKLVRIAPDGTQTELPFEARNGRLIVTLDFANSALPVMLFRLVPQTTVL